MVVGGVRPQRARRWPVEDGESGLSLWGCAALRCDVRISDKKYVVKHHDSRVRFFQSEACFVLALLLGDIISSVGACARSSTYGGTAKGRNGWCSRREMCGRLVWLCQESPAPPKASGPPQHLRT